MSIKNKAEVNVDEVLNTNKPRIEWNFLTRRFLGPEGCSKFYEQLRKFRCLPLEIFITKHVEVCVLSIERLHFCKVGSHFHFSNVKEL